ncbi:MAG: ACP S-malonyltransferase, partial [Planctomycetota bacterium]
MTQLAFLFPGQGAQTVGMAKDLHEAYPAVRALYDRAAKAVPFDIRKISFEGPEEELKRTDVSQPAIVLASLAALEALKAELGGALPAVKVTLGLSLGEYSALA